MIETRLNYGEWFDILHAVVKIYGVLRKRPAAQQRVDVGLELDVHMILEDADFADEKVQIVPVELVLLDDVIKDVQHRFCGAVHANDRVALIPREVDLVLQALNLPQQLLLRDVVNVVENLLLLRVLEEIPGALPLEDLELLLQAREHGLQILGAALGLGDVLILPADLGVQSVEHLGGIVPREADVVFHERVERLHADVVAGAGLEPAPVIFAAAVGVLEVGAAHSEHGAAAVAALEEARVNVVVLLRAAVVHRAAAGAQLAHGGEGAVVDDRLVVVFDHDVLARVAGHVLAVDLLAGVLALAQRADIKVVVEDALNRLDRPRGLDPALRFLALGLAAELLGHARRRDALLREVVRDLLVAPAVEVAREDLPDNVRLRGHDLKLLLRCHDISVGRGADPLAVLLLAVHDGADLL